MDRQKEATGILKPEEVRNRIAALRKAKGWTQKQLAEQLNITDKALSRWERGLNFPDLTIVEPLAALLEISPSELLSLDEKNAAWFRELKNRTWINLVCCILLLAANLYISWYLDKLGQYGFPQGLSGGMSGLIGTMIGFALWTLRMTAKQQKQLRQDTEKQSSAPDTSD